MTCVEVTWYILPFYFLDITGAYSPNLHGDAYVTNGYNMCTVLLSIESIQQFIY